MRQQYLKDMNTYLFYPSRPKSTYPTLPQMYMYLHPTNIPGHNFDHL